MWMMSRAVTSLTRRSNTNKIENEDKKSMVRNACHTFLLLASSKDSGRAKQASLYQREVWRECKYPTKKLFSWATWIRTALAVEPIQYSAGVSRAIYLHPIGSTNVKWESGNQINFWGKYKARGAAQLRRGDGMRLDACIVSQCRTYDCGRSRPPSCHTNKKNDPQMRVVLVGLPGFEPRMTGPESVVLPLHHSPIFLFDGAKVEQYFGFAKKIAKKIHIFVNIFALIRIINIQNVLLWATLSLD